MREVPVDSGRGGRSGGRFMPCARRSARGRTSASTPRHAGEPAVAVRHSRRGAVVWDLAAGRPLGSWPASEPSAPVRLASGEQGHRPARRARNGNRGRIQRKCAVRACDGWAARGAGRRRAGSKPGRLTATRAGRFLRVKLRDDADGGGRVRDARGAYGGRDLPQLRSVSPRVTSSSPRAWDGTARRWDIEGLECAPASQATLEASQSGRCSAVSRVAERRPGSPAPLPGSRSTRTATSRSGTWEPGGHIRDIYGPGNRHPPSPSARSAASPSLSCQVGWAGGACCACLTDTCGTCTCGGQAVVAERRGERDPARRQRRRRDDRPWTEGGRLGSRYRGAAARNLGYQADPQGSLRGTRGWTSCVFARPGEPEGGPLVLTGGFDNQGQRVGCESRAACPVPHRRAGWPT